MIDIWREVNYMYSLVRRLASLLGLFGFVVGYIVYTIGYVYFHAVHTVSKIGAVYGIWLICM